jgi:hypothetical protein
MNRAQATRAGEERTHMNRRTISTSLALAGLLGLAAACTEQQNSETAPRIQERLVRLTPATPPARGSRS